MHTPTLSRAVIAASSLVIAQSALAGADTQLQLYDGTGYTVGGYYDSINSSANITAGSASALGYADLSSGVLRANATSAVGDGTAALTLAMFEDDVTFSPNAAGIGYLDFHWDGTLSSQVNLANGGALLSNGQFIVTIDGSVGYQQYSDAPVQRRCPPAMQRAGRLRVLQLWNIRRSNRLSPLQPAARCKHDPGLSVDIHAQRRDGRFLAHRKHRPAPSCRRDIHVEFRAISCDGHTYRLFTNTGSAGAVDLFDDVGRACVPR